MTNNLSKKLFRPAGLVGAITLALASAGVANATLISQTFTNNSGGGIVEGGIVTFDDTSGANQLRITFDNTSTSGSDGVITGIVFNVTADINTASVLSFVDGNGVAIAGWTVGLNVNNETTPGNTVFDVAFETTNGINGGIYNAGVATDFSNVVPDIATLILTITDPNPWALSSIGSTGDAASILRMQRTEGGGGSLKIVTSTSSTSSTSGQTSSGTTTSTSSSTTTSSTTSGQTSNGTTVPEPGMLSLLGIGLLGQALLLRQRRRRLEK